MKNLIFLIVLIPSCLLGDELNPDSIKSHCEAFGGKWKANKCIDRLEFQQKAIRSRSGANRKQWCEARGGKYINHQNYIPLPTGGRCVDVKFEQGVTRLENPQLEKFQVHQDVIRECITSGLIQNNKCDVMATNEEHWYNYTEDSEYYMAPLVGAIGEIVRFANKAFYNYKGEKEEEILVSELKDYMKDGLSSCQKACVVKCATSQVLNYSSSNKTKLKGVADLYDERIGECTEFQSVANDLGRKLGVDVRSMSGPGHAYNAFKIDGLWYYGEPQSKDCSFYHSTHTADEYQTVFGLTPEQLNSKREISKGTIVDDSPRQSGKGTTVRIE